MSCTAVVDMTIDPRIRIYNAGTPSVEEEEGGAEEEVEGIGE